MVHLMLIIVSTRCQIKQTLVRNAISVVVIWARAFSRRLVAILLRDGPSVAGSSPASSSVMVVSSTCRPLAPGSNLWFPNMFEVSRWLQQSQFFTFCKCSYLLATFTDVPSLIEEDARSHLGFPSLSRCASRWPNGTTLTWTDGSLFSCSKPWIQCT